MILCREPSREEVSQPFLKPYSVSDSVRSTALVGCFHTYSTTAFHILSLFLKELSSLSCALYFLPHATNDPVFLKKILTGGYVFYFRERGGERDRQTDRNIYRLPPVRAWLKIKPTASWCEGWSANQLSHPARANGSILCDLAERFDTAGYFLFLIVFFLLLFRASECLPASLNPPSQWSPSWNLLLRCPCGTSVPVVSRIPCSSHISLLESSHSYFVFYYTWSFDEFQI